MLTKVCSKCGQEKDIDEFGKCKSFKDGINIYCKDCQRERNRQWAANNREKTRESSRNWRKKNPEKFSASTYLWRSKNVEKVQYSQQKWYQANSDKVREKNKKWYIDNHLRYLLSICFDRARKKNIPYGLIDDLYNYLKPIYDIEECEICHCKLETKYGNKHPKDNSPSIDRIKPELGYVMNNIAIICYKCNRIKNNGTWQEHQMIADWQKYKENNISLSQIIL